jgi:hypothetical protein
MFCSFLDEGTGWPRRLAGGAVKARAATGSSVLVPGQPIKYVMSWDYPAPITHRAGPATAG